MNTHFKPLALATAVASATAMYSGVISAQGAPTVSPDGLGDMAIIPYYSVEGDFQTGMHIINTSEFTQVVKLRFRRASDSMDALDIDLVMSPKDEWTGSLSDDSGEMLLVTEDKTCTVPENSLGKDPGVFAFPDLYRKGAEEGYIEVIAMGSPELSVAMETPTGPIIPGTPDHSEDSAIAEAAVHVDGVPRSCDSVRDNFFSRNQTVADIVNKPLNDYGNFSNEATTMEWWDDLDDIGDSGKSDPYLTVFEDSDNVLRVSYFLRDAKSGLEFGSDAVHIHDFLNFAAMTNQQYGLFSGDITGFDYPDLNGGVPAWAGIAVPPTATPGPNRARFDVLRDILGVESVLNDWSTASDRNVSTDWVVTFPGQYTMLDYYLYTTGEVIGAFGCGDENPADENSDVPECDFRDLPIRADLSGSIAGVYDREEGILSPEDGDLVVSPSIPGAVASTSFEHEVNVIEWSDGVNKPVLGSKYTVHVDTSEYDQPFGWAQLAVRKGNNTSADAKNRPHNPVSAPAICDWDAPAAFVDVGVGKPLPLMTCTSAGGGIPMVGFVAWERSFPADPSANYGRITDHASTRTAAQPPPP